MVGIGFGEFVVLSLIWAVWPFVGQYVASQKRRSRIEGALLGILGPFGVIIEALLPTLPDPWQGTHSGNFH